VAGIASQTSSVRRRPRGVYPAGPGDRHHRLPGRPVQPRACRRGPGAHGHGPRRRPSRRTGGDGAAPKPSRPSGRARRSRHPGV